MDFFFNIFHTAVGWKTLLMGNDKFRWCLRAKLLEGDKCSPFSPEESLAFDPFSLDDDCSLHL